MFSNSFIILCRNFFSSEYYAGFPWPSSSPWISSSDLCGKPDYLWTTVAVLRHVGTISWRPWEGMGHAEFIQHAFCFQAVNSFDGHSQVHRTTYDLSFFPFTATTTPGRRLLSLLWRSALGILTVTLSPTTTSRILHLPWYLTAILQSRSPCSYLVVCIVGFFSFKRVSFQFLIFV